MNFLKWDSHNSLLFHIPIFISIILIPNSWSKLRISFPKITSTYYIKLSNFYKLASIKQILNDLLKWLQNISYWNKNPNLKLKKIQFFTWLINCLTFSTDKMFVYSFCCCFILLFFHFSELSWICSCVLLLLIPPSFCCRTFEYDLHLYICTCT